MSGLGISRLAGKIDNHMARVCVRACVRECMRACVRETVSFTLFIFNMHKYFINIAPSLINYIMIYNFK